MYKVLLVDDEVFARKGLKNLIDWEDLGYTVSGEAENGEEALAVMESSEPDLVITDIRMPVLNGLELIRAVREKRQSDYAFIVVSGYDEFKYAQQAVRYGVHDYILKPIDEEELKATLRKLSRSLGFKKLIRKKKGKNVSESILEALLQGNIGEEEAGEFAAALQMDGSHLFCYILIEVHPKRSAVPPAEEARQAIGEAVRRMDGDSAEAAPVPVCEQQPGRYGILINSRRMLHFGGNLESYLNALHANLAQALAASLTLYAGKPVNRIHLVKESYDTANEAVQYKYARDGEPVVRYDSVRSTPLHYLDMDQSLYAQLLEQLEENDSAAFLATVDRMFRLFRAKRFAPAAVSNSITRCVIGIIRIIQEMGGDENRLASLGDMIGWQRRNWDLKGLRELFACFLLEASAYIARLRKEQARGGIQRVKSYIEAHYMENISLKSISGKFYMNPVYLGQLFRKTYGVYFNEFLLSLRIREAKKLLRQTGLRIYEVAEKVGFQNPDYFVTQFEKLERMTPTEYRSLLLGGKRTDGGSR